MSTVQLTKRISYCYFNGTVAPEFRSEKMGRCPLSLSRHSLTQCPCVISAGRETEPGSGRELIQCTFPSTRDGQPCGFGGDAVKFAESLGLKIAVWGNKATENGEYAGESLSEMSQQNQFNHQNGESNVSTAVPAPAQSPLARPATQPAKPAVAASPAPQTNPSNTTKVATAPVANAAPAATPANGTAAIKPLWPKGFKIPFIGITGEFQAGKTLFGLLIDPPHCVHFDFEKSAETYKSGLPFTHIDMADEMLKKFPNGKYGPIDLFIRWREILQSFPRDKFRVVVIDDISSLELGLSAYIRKHPQEFGYTINQFLKSEPLAIGATKAYWKQLLLTAGIECCVMITHMRNQFSGNKPTGRREAKGLETIMELASLYMKLDRKPDDKGKVPEKPNAIMLKNRLSVFVLNNETGEMEPHPALPPRVTGCTPARIRWYLENPPDYAKLKKDELAVAEQLSDDEKLLLQSQIAADSAESAKAQIVVTENQAKTEAWRLMQMQGNPASRNADQSGTAAQVAEQRAADSADNTTIPVEESTEAEGETATSDVDCSNGENMATADETTMGASEAATGTLDTTDSAGPMITAEQISDIKLLRKQLDLKQPRWLEILAKKFQKATALELTEIEAARLISGLIDIRSKREVVAKSAEVNQWANSVAGGGNAGATEEAPFTVPN